MSRQHVERGVIQPREAALSQFFPETDLQRFYPSVRIRRAARCLLSDSPQDIEDVRHPEAEAENLFLEESPHGAGLRYFLVAVIGERLCYLFRPEIAPLCRCGELFTLRRIVVAVFLRSLRAGVAHFACHIGPEVAFAAVSNRARLFGSVLEHRRLREKFLRYFIPQGFEMRCHKLRRERRAKLVQPVLIVVLRRRLTALWIHVLRANYAV